MIKVQTIREAKIKKAPPNTIIIRRPDGGGITFDYVLDAPGITFSFDGRRYHVLQFEGGKLVSFNPYEDTTEQTPDELGEARCWDLARRVYSHKARWADTVIAIGMIALVGIFVFITYLLLQPTQAI